MSNIATNSIVGKIFSPIVTNLTYDELDEMRVTDVSINIPNCILFSIPTTFNSGKNMYEDNQNEGSIWVTDTNGYLYCMTKPINKYLESESLVDLITPTSNINGDKKIVSVKWYPGEDIINRNSEQGNNPILNLNALIIKYDDDTEEKQNINTINNFKLKVTLDQEGENLANSFWYNNPGTYYIKGIILSYRTIYNKDLETDNILKWTIEKNNSIEPDIPDIPDTPDTPDIPDEPDTIYYWYIGIENPDDIYNIETDNIRPGWHEIGTSVSGFILDTNTNKIKLSTTRVIYYIIIPNELHIYNGLNVNVESIDFETVTCNISGYKAFRFVPEEGVTGVKTVQGPIIRQSI